MKQPYFPGWTKSKNTIELIESNGMKKILVKGRLYLSWQVEDIASQRMAIVQLYESELGTQEELARIFGIHINAVQKYITNFAKDGLFGLVPKQTGPKEPWKLTPRLRCKILLISLKEGILKYEVIQKRLKEWGEEVSIPSIRQVLLENGLAEEGINEFEEPEQNTLFNNHNDDRQLYLDFDWGKRLEGAPPDEVPLEKEVTKAPEEINLLRRSYSRAQRVYLDQLEQGYYNTYAGALLFVPLLQRYSFLPTIKRIIDIPTYEGYSLEELCLTLFYFDLFSFRSMEDFKRVYREEFGALISRLYSPSLFTLRRFLHKIRELEKSEKLIDEFALLYLKKGIVKWGVLYIDGHFLPYYGMYPISMGWHGVRKIPMKGSYNFISTDDKFTPLIFLIRSSREDLLQKIPEIIKKVKKIARYAGLSKEKTRNPIVIFDREGYSAELYRYLEGKDTQPQKRKAIFITWAKYTEKWVNDIPDEKFNDKLTVTYEIQSPKEIKYFQTERTMNKYGKIRAIVIERVKDKSRCAIYTNARDDEIAPESVVQLMSQRWGEENLIKELLLKHLINYSPGYDTEEIETQPMVDNPKLKELKQKRTNLKNDLAQIKSKFGHEVLLEMEKEANWDEIKTKRILTMADIQSIRSEITLLNQKIDTLPARVRFDEAHDGKRLVELNYEKKQFLDCIKVFTYNMQDKMCQMLLNYYDKKKELLPLLSMITERAGYIKLENNKLKILLKRFKNPEVNYAARHLCEDLNKMKPATLDKFQFPIRYEISQ